MNQERYIAKNGRKHLAGVCVLLLLFASLLWATARPASVRADDFGDCVQTYTLGASGQAATWNEAVAHAKTLGNDTSYIKVKMNDNWTLAGNESGAGFNDGRLYIPANAKILLDLNGWALDRNLTTATENGSVLYVQGALKIADSDPDSAARNIRNAADAEHPISVQGGVITGGYTAGNGGAILVAKAEEGASASGSLIVAGGSIAGNIAARNGIDGGNGGAIWVQGELHREADITVAGGALIGNKAAQGGAVAVDSNARLIVSGGKITGNVATENAGGVAIFGGNVTVDGSAYILGNKTGEAQANNLVLSDGNQLYIGDALLTENVETAEVKKDKAEIGITYAGTGNIVANNYNAYAQVPDLSDGGVHFYAKNVAPCFTVDGNTDGGANNKYVAVNSDGKLAIATAQVEWSASDITLSGIAGDEFTDSVKLAANLKKYNGIAFTYDGDTEVQYRSTAYADVCRKKKASTDSNPEGEDNPEGEVIAHKLTKTVGGVDVAFYVYIAPVSIEQASVTWNWGADNAQKKEFAFTGKPIGPSVTSVTLAGVSDPLRADSDYTVVHNNVRVTFPATSASSTVKGVGNYTGEVQSFGYAIVRNSSVTYTVTWQKREDVGTIDAGQETERIEYRWNDFTVTEGVEYAAGVDYGAYIRAKLTVSGTDYVEYVYAAGNDPFPNGKPDDLDVSTDGNKITVEQYSTQMHLAFTRDSENVTMVTDAAIYSVAINGTGSCAFAEDGASLTVRKKELTLSQANVAKWKLYFGEEAGKTYTMVADDDAGLTDSIVTGDGSTKYVADNLLQPMKNGASYIWYRDAAMRMVLDGMAAVASDDHLYDYLRLASITVRNYVSGGSASGTEIWNEAESVLHPGINECTRYKTTVTVTFDKNYTVTGGTDGENGDSVITVESVWSVVTKPNNITAQGNVPSDNAFAWTYGENTAPQFTTQNGDTVLYAFTDNASVTDTTVRFAQVHSGSSNVYYGVKEVNGAYVPDPDKRLTPGYYADYLNRLAASETAYTMTVSAPDFTDTNGIVAYAVPQTYSVTVAPRALANLNETPVRMLQLRVPYSGAANNTPEIELALQANGHVFTEGVDYELVSEQVAVGVSDLTVRGIGSLSGEITLVNAYEITKAENGWRELPGLVSWKFGDYDQAINAVTGTPELLDDASSLWFKITTDAAGENAAAPALEKFAFTNGALDADTVTALAGLRAGTYRLFACVDETDNYYAMQNSVTFVVLQAANGWRVTPSVTNWVKGKYNAEKNALQAESRFGTAHVVVTNSKGKVYYDSATGVNRLSSAKAGRYVLTASVAGTSDYGELVDYVFNFQVLAPGGMPWWGILLIVIAALGVVALVIFLLWKFGVFRIFNDRMLVKLRTEATVEATVAAVRASKANDEAKISIAKAEEADRLAAEAQAKEEAKQKRAEAAKAKRAAAAAEKEAAAQAESAATQPKAVAPKAKAKPRK